MKRVIVLLSGGIDSAVALQQARYDGHECFCLTFDYGQKNRQELGMAKEQAQFCAFHKILKLPLDKLFTSGLFRGYLESNRPIDEIDTTVGRAYVPARNLIFLSIAIGWAEQIEATEIFTGFYDGATYPDATPKTCKIFTKIANKFTTSRNKIKIHPVVRRGGKRAVISKGLALGVQFEYTSSCFSPDPSGAPCGVCDACITRAAVFEELEILDPALKGSK